MPGPCELGVAPLITAPSLSQQLEETGWAVCSDAASPAFCAAVRAEICSLHSTGQLSASLNRVATERGSNATDGDGHLCAKHGVYELDVLLDGAVVAPAALKASPALTAWLGASRLGSDAGCGCSELVAQLNLAAPWLALRSLDTLKVQFNTGEGGCFPYHIDTTDRSQRTLTAILYLSEQWEDRHGGALRIIPFPLAPVEIAPRAGTLALFSSTTTLHRVLPAHAPRCVLSLWFTGAKVLFPSRLPAWTGWDGSVSLHPQLTPTVLAFLRRPANARVLLKVLLADEWADSITQAFGHSAGVHAALALHYHEVESLEAQISVPLLHLLRRLVPLTRASDGPPG